MFPYYDGEAHIRDDYYQQNPIPIYHRLQSRPYERAKAPAGVTDFSAPSASPRKIIYFRRR
ncbi:MAG: hypothetical protein Fur0021_17590 [Candidatus Promineifilaceae bacterium]